MGGHASGARPISRSAAALREPFPEIDGSSAEVRRLKQHMACVARDGHVTVLLLGESGTGKERIARGIHRASPRAGAPFVVIDCGALSATLAEDTLFGHVRGAFTGAIDERTGPFEAANGGTVLLDEVGDLSLELQMKLLRALQSRTVQRLGARQAVPFDARIIAATHVDLVAAKEHGRFREDLYYRLSVYPITVPPLRRRGAADIRALASAVLQDLAARRGQAAPQIDAAAMDLLERYSWPGNVRQLENAVERMLVAADGAQTLEVRHLPPDVRHGLAQCISMVRGRPRPAGEVAELSAAQVLAALERNAFRRGRTAADLAISRHQLYRLVRRYGLRPAPGAP